MSKRKSRAERPSKIGAVVDPVFYAAWNAAHSHCQCCGIVAAPWPGLSTHHICKFRRSDEPTNLIRLCQSCHDLAELKRVCDPNGQPYNILRLEHVLWLKKTREPDAYDPARLTVLHGRDLPRLCPPDTRLLQLWQRHQQPFTDEDVNIIEWSDC